MLRPELFVAAASLSGAIIPEAWATTPLWEGLLSGAFGRPVDPARFRAASPFTLVQLFAQARPRPVLFLSCGDDDELGLEEGAILLHLALKRAGVDPELRITDGGHSWEVWSRELEPALRFIGAAFAAP